MSLNPVNGWDKRLFAVAEATLATTPAPASPAAYAAQAIEFISANLGPGEVGKVRGKKDRNQGRDMQSAFIEGRVEPIPFSVVASMKGRAAIDAAPQALALLRAAGLKSTINSGVSYVLSPSATPIESGDFASCSLTEILGAQTAAYQAEILRGCIVDKLRFEGGDKELTLTASGKGVGKLVQGALDSVTLASAVVTTLTHTAEESYRLEPGYYLCESEVVQVTVVGYGSTSSTIARGALGTTAAAHTAAKFQPYVPPSITYSGAPISEVVTSFALGGVSIPVTSWYVEISTGAGFTTGEVGSKYAQNVRFTRYDVKVGAKLVLRADNVSLLGKVRQRPTVALALSQGAGVGGIFSLGITNAEVEPFAVPDVANDVATVDVTLRVRDSGTASDAFSVTLT
jgi:hypothetical protein